MRLAFKQFTESPGRSLMIRVLILSSISGALALGMLRCNNHHKILSGRYGRTQVYSQSELDKIKTIDSVRLTITRTGIIPAEVEVREGHFYLQIDSLIGKDNPNYVITKEGRQAKEIRPVGGSRRWREVMSLSPGDYVISVVGESQLRSLLRVVHK